MSSEREEEAAKKPNLSEVLSKDRESFIGFLGSIYEHSAWVAEELYDGKLPDDTNNIQKISDLFERMKTIVDSSSQTRKLELLRAHPDLCERVQTLKTLTKASQEEQSRAGLQFLTEEEKAVFLKANTTYKEKFGFPFILAVRNASKYTVLSAIQARVKTDSIETEMNAAVGQVHKIAWMRLLSAIETPEPKGFLTCHVLDTASGTPAANMRIHLYRINPADNSRIFLNEFITNSDGRLSSGPALKGKDFVAGVYYEWIFFVGDYFAQLPHLKTSGTPFLNEVPIRFGMDDPDEHYHVPLLVSPFGFSTYRGS